MRRWVASALCCFFILFIAACQNTKTRAVEGSVIGGLLGGAAGGIIGHQSGNAGVGAGIGVAAGAITGALIGSHIDKPQKQQETTAQIQPSTNQAALPSVSTGVTSLSTQQIIEFTKQGMAESEIIAKIKASNVQFSLSEDDVVSLQKQGVSPEVIAVMRQKGK